MKAGGRPSPPPTPGPNQVERTSAGKTRFTNSLLGLSTTQGGATTGTTRDSNGSLVGLRSRAGRSYYFLDGINIDC